MKKGLFVVLILAVATTGSLLAQSSSFQNTCSNISFSYGNGTQALLQAMCLAADGTAKSSSLALRGIGNSNGKLVQQGTGSSSFQQSCGNIQIQAASSTQVNLTALCRTTSGSSVQSSLALSGISNQNGSLSY